jgi:hypothetical protein
MDFGEQTDRSQDWVPFRCSCPEIPPANDDGLKYGLFPTRLPGKYRKTNFKPIYIEMAGSVSRTSRDTPPLLGL